MKSSLLLSFACLILHTTTSFAQSDNDLGKLLRRTYPTLKEGVPILVMISFDSKEAVESPQDRLVSDRSLKRRSKMRTPDALVDEMDLPVNKRYIEAVRPLVLRIRHELKWFNAVTAIATKNQIDELRQLVFVKDVELVGRWKVDRERAEGFGKGSEKPPRVFGDTLDYDSSYTQLRQINVPAVHQRGIYGQGVMIGVFDNGFRLLSHEAFDSMSIVATYDFVDHKVDVAPNNPSTGFGAHGINTLSTIGGYKPGKLIGPAFRSDFVLARTENDSSETPVEEDNWAKAIEWADSIGIDVASTSLGYLSYEAPYPSWTWEDMDGNTTLITRAADRAVSLGIVVVNSAGNSGSNSSRNTLGAPADGDSVIAAGAVDSFGVRASFSSVGPTTDGRIKPDVMAMGRRVYMASAVDPSGYQRASGTSFSCPLIAGVAALVLSANPNLSPIHVREALRQTATNADSPNNQMGWGIVDALAAVGYYEQTQFLEVSSGWNLLSLPVSVEDRSVRWVYGEDSSASAFVYDAGYTRVDSLPYSDGYWVKFGAQKSVLISGKFRMLDTVRLKNGWNLVGSVAEPVAVSDILESPEGLIASDFFRYRSGYEIADTLMPGDGYWVKANGEGTIILDASITAGRNRGEIDGSIRKNE